MFSKERCFCYVLSTDIHYDVEMIEVISRIFNCSLAEISNNLYLKSSVYLHVLRSYNEY